MRFDQIFNNLALIKKMYSRNENIISFISKVLFKSSINTIEAVLTSYDLQAGTSIDYIKNNPDYPSRFTPPIVELLERLGCKNSLMEAGCGELTTIANVVSRMSVPPKHVLGFDISLSRLHLGIKYFNDISHHAARKSFFCADLFDIPLSDNSVEIVYTLHTIESNSGRTKEAIMELYRVCSSYLILLEPSYEDNSKEGKLRMENHGYIKDFKGPIKELGLNLVDYFKLPYNLNPLHEAWAYVIKKEDSKSDHLPQFICPYTKQRLEAGPDSYFVKEYLAYPVISGIPYILKSHAILKFH